MTDNADEPRPVKLTSPRYSSIDRTNDIRIQKDAAQRLIARYLRESGTQPAAANSLANAIVDGLISNMSAPVRPALRGWRMIDRYPPDDVAQRVAAAFKSIRLNADTDWALATEVWETVYKFGTALPDDIVA